MNQKPYWSGRKHTEETKRKQSLSKLGNRNPAKREDVRKKLSDAKKGKTAWNKGLTHETDLRIRKASAETRKKQSDAHSGFKHQIETRKSISESHKGKNLSKVHRANISLSKKEMFIKNPEMRKDLSELFKRTWELHRVDLTSIAKQNIRQRDRCEVCGKLIGENHSCKNPFQGKTHTKEVRDILRNNMRLRRMSEIFPKKDTSIEIKIQGQLRELGYDFFTHQYRTEIEHGYQCDIFVPSLNLVIECDGDYWHKYPVGNDIDHVRTSELIAKGFKVLRLWEKDIRMMSLDDLKEKISKI